MSRRLDLALLALLVAMAGVLIVLFRAGVAAPAPAPAAALPAPAPFVPTSARAAPVHSRRAPPPSRSLSSARPAAVNVDGCDHAYGSRSECIPWTFPPGVTDKCAWLASHGYRNVRVVGADRQHLDPDGDRIACNGPP